MPEVNCDVTCRYSWLFAVFGIQSSLLENTPRRIADWAERDVIGIGGSERNSHKASAAQLSVEGGACILSVTTADCAESHEYTEVNYHKE